MELEQKKYTFACSDGSKQEVNAGTELFLVVNDNKTSVNISSLFTKISEFDGGKITGYSILENLAKDKTRFLDTMEIDNGKFKVGFLNKATGDILHISDIRNPLFQDDEDETISVEELTRLALLITAPTSEVTSLGSTVVADLKPEAPKVVIIEPEISEPADYIEGKEQLTADGYKELKFKSYRFLVADNKPAILVKISADGFEELEVSKTDHLDVYKANDEGKQLMVKIIDGNLLVE